MKITATLLLLVAGVCFILGLKMLAKSTSARRGNLVSAAGMAAAILGTCAAILADQQPDRFFTGGPFFSILAGLIVGAAIGVPVAIKVKMTAMPEVVALFNGFGGIASLLIGWGELARTSHIATNLARTITDPETLAIQPPGFSTLAVVSVFLAIFIGGVTFTGSLIAFGKLSGKVPSPPVLYPAQRPINIFLTIALLACGVWIAIDPLAPAPLYAAIILALILGVAFVIPIGGGDMPVVISLLNSYSGLAACAAGFAVQNTLLIIAGALVGASGIILTRIMCLAMNRSLPNVLFSGFGAAATASTTAASDHGEAKIITPDKAYYMLQAAQRVIIVPGYGMAVAQAQHAVKELSKLLEHNGTEVQFVVHPVAGRMPGHMNVLLAEADVPYESLFAPEDVNPTMESVDAAIVLGANDVVNPLALQPDSPIAGMPIVEVHRARVVFTLKRSMRSGYAGIDNPLFYLDNNYMILGDAKETVRALADEFKAES